MTRGLTGICLGFITLTFSLGVIKYGTVPDTWQASFLGFNAGLPVYPKAYIFPGWIPDVIILFDISLLLIYLIAGPGIHTVGIFCGQIARIIIRVTRIIYKWITMSFLDRGWSYVKGLWSSQESDSNSAQAATVLPPGGSGSHYPLRPTRNNVEGDRHSDTSSSLATHPSDRLRMQMRGQNSLGPAGFQVHEHFVSGPDQFMGGQPRLYDDGTRYTHDRNTGPIIIKPEQVIDRGMINPANSLSDNRYQVSSISPVDRCQAPNISDSRVPVSNRFADEEQVMGTFIDGRGQLPNRLDDYSHLSSRLNNGGPMPYRFSEGNGPISNRPDDRGNMSHRLRFSDDRGRMTGSFTEEGAQTSNRLPDSDGCQLPSATPCNNYQAQNRPIDYQGQTANMFPSAVSAPLNRCEDDRSAISMVNHPGGVNITDRLIDSGCHTSVNRYMTNRQTEASNNPYLDDRQYAYRAYEYPNNITCPAPNNLEHGCMMPNSGPYVGHHGRDRSRMQDYTVDRMQPNFQSSYQQDPPQGYYPSKSRRKPKEPMKFNGRGDFDDYWGHFEAIAQWNQWDYQEKGMQLACSLIEEARGVLSTIPFPLAHDYNSLVDAIKRKYSPEGSESQYSVELMNRVCKPNESVAHYGHALQRLAARAYPGATIAEPIMVDMFVKGLPDLAMRRHVHSSKPKSLPEAITTAVSYQAFDMCQQAQVTRKPQPTKHVSVAQVTAAPPSGQNSNQYNTQVVARPIPRPGANGNGQRQFRQKRDLSTVECFKCHQMGHYSRDCPSNNYATNTRPTAVPVSQMETAGQQSSPLNV